MINERSINSAVKNKLKKYDEDVISLLEKSDLPDFDYRHLAQLDRLETIGTRWPLLAEIALSQREPSV
ncbi:BcsR/BcsP family cellulose biosynthesis protein [Halomonas sp. M20]|uniref:BcsR/BcsP family cellulose biosynthesis protein n=1 Tax=Halomonas sp. M20 TaxID=2763264 RepID=UPI001D0AB552|nr:BcsR/BcsP family cellulose biosynthesis protein [Halomonas sp. M20]